MKVTMKYRNTYSGKEDDLVWENIDPSTILIVADLVAFGEKDSDTRHWTFPLSKVVEMHVKED